MHCLAITLFRVSQLQWVKAWFTTEAGDIQNIFLTGKFSWILPVNHLLQADDLQELV